MDPASNNALKAYDDALMNMVAISIEARVCQRALEQCPRFIKAFESASSDCGVVLEDILDQSEGPARAIFTLLRGALHKEIMLFLDIKHIEAVCDSKHGGAFAYTVSSSQRSECAALMYHCFR